MDLLQASLVEGQGVLQVLHFIHAAGGGIVTGDGVRHIANRLAGRLAGRIAHWCSGSVWTPSSATCLLRYIGIGRSAPANRSTGTHRAQS